MSFTNQTTHYGLPQWIGSDKPTYLVDQNNAYQTIDSELYNANTASGEAVTTAQGAVTTAEGAASTAATALSTAQGAETTANSADGKADNAITLAQSAQTAAGAAQTAAEAAQTAAAGNSITNLAPAYDPTQTYSVGDLVTQDGKLYQCITQVSSPEAFDINKWDDKTTSEVYSKKFNGYIPFVHTTYTIPANTYSTYGDALDWIKTHAQDILGLSSGVIADDLAIQISGYGTMVRSGYGTYDSTSTNITGRFHFVDGDTSTLVVNCIDFGQSSPVFVKWTIASGNIAVTDARSATQNRDIVIAFTKNTLFS